MATKDFGAIADDYAFFMTQSTEAERDRHAYQQALTNFPDGRESIRVLDFGCGTGDFSVPLFTLLNWPRQTVQFTLLEPVKEQRETAAPRFQSLTDHPIEFLDSVERAPGESYDLILANHVLYYVDDLNATLDRLHTSLRAGGQFLLAIAGWDNPLMQLWQTGFASRGLRVPYYAADDVEAAFTRQSVKYQKSPVEYELRFPDSTENRMRILQFLFGDHLSKLRLAPLLNAFNDWERGDEILVTGTSQHFQIAAPAEPKSPA